MTKLMIRTVVHISPLLMTLMLAGCAVEKPKPFPSQAPLQSLSGVVVESQDQLWFQPCHEKRWWPLQDFTEQQALTEYYQRFTEFSKKELYMELQGAVEPALDNRLLVKQIDTVGGTAATCNFRLDGIVYRAASSDPYWVADIRTDHVVVKSIKPLGRYRFKTLGESEAKDSKDDDTEVETPFPVIARYQEVKPSKKPFQITIMQQRCIDSASGTLLPLTAQMTFFGQQYSGCARQGHTAIEAVTGLYWYQPPEGHQVMFKLSDDNQVQLVSRDAAGKVVTEKGRWQYLQSGKLIFSMLDANQHEYLMLFRRTTAGPLVLQTGSERLAALGATFQLWQPSGLEGGQLLPSDQERQISDDHDTIMNVLLASDNPVPSATASEIDDSSTPAASPLTGAVLHDSPVQAADIDDELLNEIIVDDAKQK
ncbi:hypothetical protein [Amphritea sp.]|uniref:hypothetical protein n=1 Tax=Amphritea sp. TaxID=1872502 RepID=UPI003A95CB0E